MSRGVAASIRMTPTLSYSILLRYQHPLSQAMLHQDAHEEGGLGFTNKELLAQQRGWGSCSPTSGFRTCLAAARLVMAPCSCTTHPHSVLPRLCRAILDIAKDVGRKLLTGSLNLINLSMPVRMFEDRSYLQKLADVWVYPR